MINDQIDIFHHIGIHHPTLDARTFRWDRLVDFINVIVEYVLNGHFFYDKKVGILSDGLILTFLLIILDT